MIALGKRTRRNRNRGINKNTNIIPRKKSAINPTYTDFAQCDTYIISAHGRFRYNIHDEADYVFFNNRAPNAYIAYTAEPADICLINIDEYLEHIFREPVDILKSLVGHYNMPIAAAEMADIDTYEYVLDHLYWSGPSTPKCPNITLDISSEHNNIYKGIKMMYNYPPSDAVDAGNKEIIRTIVAESSSAHMHEMDLEDIYEMIVSGREARLMKHPFIIVVSACGDDEDIDEETITVIERSMRQNHLDFLERVAKENITSHELPLARDPISNPLIIHIPTAKQIVKDLDEIYEYDETNKIQVEIRDKIMILIYDNYEFKCNIYVPVNSIAIEIIPFNTAAINAIRAPTSKIQMMVKDIADHLHALFDTITVHLVIPESNVVIDVQYEEGYLKPRLIVVPI
jgi:hypothetical protein